MRKISLGAGLVLRQALFLAPIPFLSAISIFSIHRVRDAILALHGLDRTSAAMLASGCERALVALYIGTVLACILALISAPVLHHRVSKPIRRLTAQLNDLARGHAPGPAGMTDRSDEIGALARAFDGLCGRISDAQSLIAELTTAKAERDAWRARKASRRSTVEMFGEELDAATNRLNEMTQLLREASESMIGQSRCAEDESALAKKASGSTAGGLASVAMASEHLANSINEISVHVDQSTRVVKTAVEEAKASSEWMSRLSSAARRIGDVVELISNIASQTNLLALNATIEAMRAGESGRGFGVVAQEVKMLAAQTGHATKEISVQIREIQSATDKSAAAMDMVCEKIRDVDRISAIIASAVREQDVSTRDIAICVQSAAADAANVRSHVDHVGTTMTQTAAAAESVRQLAEDLDHMASGMRADVQAFAEALHTSSAIQVQDKGGGEMPGNPPRGDKHRVAA